MKKILLLGGSAQQIVAIKTAKNLGYFTVLCDYLVDNPGQYYADKFYLISTTDKEAVLNVAKKEQVNGVLAYASDPAAPTAAFVAEKLGLNTSPYSSVEILCNKDKFRAFLKKNGFNSPKAGSYFTVSDALNDISSFSFPIIVKPVDSSGSKGVTVLSNVEDLEEAINFAFSFSRSHRIIVEEYIQNKYPYLLGGDIFVDKGKVVLWGLLNCHRDNSVNPLVPVGKSYPLEMNNEDIKNVKDTLQTLVDKLNIKSCGMNVELVVSKDGRVWPIDIGPRNGGNMIPDLLGLIFNVDVVEMAIKSAMGVEENSTFLYAGEPYYATHNIHSPKNGLLLNIAFSEEIKPYIIKKYIYKSKGDIVERFDNASKALGIVFMKFNSCIEMNKFLLNIDEHIKVEVE